MKYVVTFVALFAALPSICSAEDLGAFGIADVEVMTDDDGQNVRGLGMFSRTTSAAGISMNILDPNTGSQWNIFNTAFDTPRNNIEEFIDWDVRHLFSTQTMLLTKVCYGFKHFTDRSSKNKFAIFTANDCRPHILQKHGGIDLGKALFL